VQHNGRDLVIQPAPKKQWVVKNEMSSTKPPPHRNLRGNRLSGLPACPGASAICLPGGAVETIFKLMRL
jgi:hypothetical protein